MITLAIRYWYFIAIAALVALLGVQQVRISHVHAARAEDRQAFADERTRAAQAAHKAEQEARAEEQRRAAATREVVKNAQDQNKAVQADADVARADGERMRQRIAALERAARSASVNSSASGRSSDQQGSDAIGMFAKLSGGADSMAEIYARVADGRRVIAQACERAGDSLTQ